MLYVIRKFAAIFGICLISFSCSIDRTINNIDTTDQNLIQQFRELNAENRIKITDEKEPGEKLDLCITLIDKETKQVLRNQKIHFFQTDAIGDYQTKVPGDESSARLSGTTQSDSNGRVFVQTILPGDYGTSPDHRHIHTTIFGARPEGYDIHFKQYTTFMGKRFSASSDQHFLADLKRDEQGNLVAFLTIEAKFPL